MTAPRSTRRSPRRENDIEPRDAAPVAANQGDVLLAVRYELAQLRIEVAQLRGTIERVLIETGTRAVESRRREPRAEISASDPSEFPPGSEEIPDRPTSEELNPDEAPMDAVTYARLITRIRSLVRTVVPFNAVVAVVSRGDEALVELEGRIAWHFPRLEDGRWLGHHPRDSEEAIAHLERLRSQGARYLLFPSTSLWWLTHYEEFAQHLESTSTPLVRHDDACKIFALQPQEPR